VDRCATTKKVIAVFTEMTTVSQDAESSEMDHEDNLVVVLGYSKLRLEMGTDTQFPTQSNLFSRCSTSAAFAHWICYAVKLRRQQMQPVVSGIVACSRRNGQVDIAIKSSEQDDSWTSQDRAPLET
jgi:hypothetical protein